MSGTAGEPLYESYKDALRRGHVAALRGRMDEALTAYGEAATIAPERALPHASRGGILTRLGRPQEALQAYSAALDRAPREETALAGRAEALVGLGRRIEAADALDRLAETQELAGRPAEACDTARRALELAESRTRRQLVERLARRLRGSPADEAATAALERALRILEPTRARPSEPAGGPSPEPVLEDGPRLTAEAEELVMSGDQVSALAACLAAASAHRAAGHVDAAIDACYLGLSIAPDDTTLHLTLAELYVERGWHGPAAEKLVLLGRLLGIDRDAAAQERLCALVGASFADDPRLTALCS
jgi:tetratricopeptide (TPR) repeat protein